MEKRSMTEKLEAAKRFGLGLYGWQDLWSVCQKSRDAKGLTKPNQLHATATKFVSAKAQARLMQQMLEQENFLTEEELEIYKRGRNSKSHTVAKNADVGTYRIATGFEALMGYLYLSGQQARLEELINWCLQQVEGEQ